MRLEALEKDAGERVDTFISSGAGITRSAAQRLIEDGFVTFNGGKLKKNYKLAPGDVLKVNLPEPEESVALPRELPLDIVYEDNDIIVVNKAKGMVVHPAAGHRDDTLVNALLFHCGGSLSGINGELRPGIVHRLDKDTSGLMVVAKNDMAHLSLSNQLKDHTCARTYEAVIMGGLRENSGRISAPIARHKTDRKRMAVSEGGRPAATNWAVIGRYAGYTHIRCMLETGRTHQIRVHMAGIGHPVLGDMTYGGKTWPALDGQCLHAKRLEFIHPRSGEKVTFESELPDYFKNVLTKLQSRV